MKKYEDPKQHNTEVRFWGVFLAGFRGPYSHILLLNVSIQMKMGLICISISINGVGAQSNPCTATII
jgi:hypothetical protein